MSRRRPIVPAEPHLVVHDLLGTRVTLLASALAASTAALTLDPPDPVLGVLVHIESGGWTGSVVEGWAELADALQVLGDDLEAPQQREALHAHAKQLRAEGGALHSTQSEAT